jgi:hypothetical protein
MDIDQEKPRPVRSHNEEDEGWSGEVAEYYHSLWGMS